MTELLFWEALYKTNECEPGDMISKHFSFSRENKKTNLPVSYLQNQNADALRGLEKGHGIVEVVTLLQNFVTQVTKGKTSC